MDGIESMADKNTPIINHKNDFIEEKINISTPGLNSIKNGQSPSLNMMFGY